MAPNADPNKCIPRVVRKKSHLFFLVDTSESMRHGGRITYVNIAMHILIENLKKLFEDDKPYEDFIIHVLTFGSFNCGWKSDKHIHGINLYDYDWVDIPDSECGGGAPMGECIDTLMEVMSDENRKEYLGRRIRAPFLMMISDGGGKGDRDPEEAAIAVQNTTLGNVSCFAAIGIDVQDDQDCQKTLKTFGRNGFLNVADPEKLIEQIPEMVIHSLDIMWRPYFPPMQKEDHGISVIYDDGDLL